MFTWQASPTASGQFCLSKRDFTCWRKAHKARVGFRAGHPTGIRRATHGEVSTPDANSGKLTRTPARTKASQPCILRGWHTPIKQPSRSWLSQKIAHSVVSVYLRAPVRWPESLARDVPTSVCDQRSALWEDALAVWARPKELGPPGR